MTATDQSIRSVELASSSENIARAVVGQGVDHQFVDGHQRYRINRDMLVPPREWTYHPDSFLTLAAGDLVHNLSIEGNWIYGECGSRAGWFPVSVVDVGGAAIVPEEMRTNSQISFENNSPRSRKALNKLLIKNPKQIQQGTQAQATGLGAGTKSAKELAEAQAAEFQMQILRQEVTEAKASARAEAAAFAQMRTGLAEAQAQAEAETAAQTMAMVEQAQARDKAQQQEMQARATGLGTGTTVSKELAESLAQMAVSETQALSPEDTQAQMVAQENQPAEQERAQHQAQQQGAQAPVSVVDLGGAAIVQEEMRTNSQISFENNSPRSSRLPGRQKKKEEACIRRSLQIASCVSTHKPSMKDKPNM